MRTKERYEKKTESLLEPILQSHHLELVDVEYVKEAGTWFLRVYIDKDAGVTIDDCETVSRRLSDVLDREDYIETSYILEVSSPGLGRRLKKERDFLKSMGKEVEVHLYKPREGKKEFTGILVDYNGNDLSIEEDHGKVTFKKSEVSLVRLAFIFKFEEER